MPRTMPQNQIALASRYHAFDVTDARGRTIGAQVITYQVDFVEVPSETQVAYDKPAGHYFAADVRATRNTTPYGASQWPRYFASRADRDQYVATYLAAARKRATTKGASRCQLCGEPKPTGRSCDCFDNHCQ
jgi:hypothetical protein